MPASHSTPLSSVLISAQKTRSIAITFTARRVPAVTPFARESRRLVPISSRWNAAPSAVSAPSVSGTNSFARTKAAGALITDAAMRSAAPRSRPASERNFT